MRSHFSSSSLVRLLGEWTPADAQPPAGGMDFAERLSLWLDAFHAIGLQSAHQSIKALPAEAPARRAGASRAQALQEDQQRVRAALAHAIAQADPAAGLAPAEVGYAPFRQRHLELQRRMEQLLRPLRDHVRQAVGRASPRLRRLTALDAVLEQVLEPREQSLLPTAASLLERRFEALRAAGQADDPARWRDPEGWLSRFESDWRQALLAEVDLRLSPVAGLIDALKNESTDQP